MAVKIVPLRPVCNPALILIFRHAADGTPEPGTPPAVSSRKSESRTAAGTDGKFNLKKPLYSGDATPMPKINHKKTLGRSLKPAY
jgi:hypothetical protein